jgi:hypothetical protein
MYNINTGFKQDKPFFSWNMLRLLAAIYLLTPLFLFLLSWYKFPYNMDFVALLGMGIFVAFKRPSEISTLDHYDTEPHLLSPLGFGTVIFVALILSVSTGVGNIIPNSSDDYAKHNFMFNVLSKSPCPAAVQYSDGTVISIVYFIGYYIVPAIIGAHAGTLAMNIASLIWTIFGLSLGGLIFLRYFRLPAWVFAVLWGFGGLSMAGSMLINGGILAFPLNLWAFPMRCANMFQLFAWSPTYIMPVIIAAPLLLKSLDEKRTSSAAVWICAVFLWNGFMAIGLSFFLLWHLLKAGPRKMFAIENWALLVGGLFPMAVYFSTKIFPEKFYFIANRPEFWRVFPAFFIMELGVWFLLLSKEEWKRSRAVLTLLLALIVPLFALGSCEDWCFKTLAVAQIILAGLVFRSLITRPKWYRCMGFVLCYAVSLLSAVEPLFVINKAAPFWYGDAIETDILSQNAKPDIDYLMDILPHSSQLYMGDPNASVASTLLLQQPKTPLQINQKYSLARIWHKFFGRTHILSGYNSYYLFNSEARVWICNPTSPRKVHITMTVMPHPPKPRGYIILAKRAVPEIEQYKVDMSFDRFLHHRPWQGTDKSAVPFKLISAGEKLSCTGNISLDIPILLPHGYTEIGIRYDEGTHLDSNFCVGNFAVDETAPSPSGYTRVNL